MQEALASLYDEAAYELSIDYKETPPPLNSATKTKTF
jgi:hypothetical protein